MTHAPWRGRIFTAIWVVALLAVFLLPYAQVSWWSFAASTAALLALAWLRWGGAALRRLGLPVEPASIAWTVAAGLALYALFRLVVVPSVAAREALTLTPYPPRIAVSFVFQTLNEELVLGALLVIGLARWTRRPILTVLVVAGLFALLHLLLYRYGTIGLDLLPVTLATLAAVGVIRGAAILLAGHVGFAWALHAAFNLTMFAGRWRETSSGRVLQEPEILDAFLRPPWIVLPAAVVAVLLVGLLRRVGPRYARV